MHSCFFSFQLSLSLCMDSFQKMPFFPPWPTSNWPPTLTCGSSHATYPLCASSISLVIARNFSLSSTACVFICVVLSLSVSTIWTAISSLTNPEHSTWVYAISVLDSSTYAMTSSTLSWSGSI
jgi:hypothetical protein